MGSHDGRLLFKMRLIRLPLVIYDKIGYLNLIYLWELSYGLNCLPQGRYCTVSSVKFAQTWPFFNFPILTGQTYRTAAGGFRSVNMVSFKHKRYRCASPSYRTVASLPLSYRCTFIRNKVK